MATGRWHFRDGAGRWQGNFYSTIAFADTIFSVVRTRDVRSATRGYLSLVTAFTMTMSIAQSRRPFRASAHGCLSGTRGTLVNLVSDVSIEEPAYPRRRLTSDHFSSELRRDLLAEVFPWGDHPAPEFRRIVDNFFA